MNHPYLPLTDDQRREMLAKIGVSDFEALLAAIPFQLRLKQPLNLPPSLTEMELSRFFQGLAGQNAIPELSFIGAGAYQHYIPSVVNHLAARSEFYTAYTPYQPEISQGMLQAIFEYQTYVSELFSLPIANASLYDGPTALAEAVLMAVKETGRSRVILLGAIHPAAVEVVKTYLKFSSAELVIIPDQDGRADLPALQRELAAETAAVAVQNPNFYGIIEDLPDIIERIKAAKAVPICYVHPLTLGLLEAPGRLGAEIVVAEGQPLGNPVAYGGPYLGMMAVSERFLRRIPGRLVGETVDRQGRRSYVLTLQTREQHIRREKATSNICSNEALCALRAAIYLSVIGPEGLRSIASRCFDNAHYLQERLASKGFRLCYDQPFFMEFAIVTPKPAALYIEKLRPKGILPGLDLGGYNPAFSNRLLICATEIFAQAQLDRFVTEMGEVQ